MIDSKTFKGSYLLYRKVGSGMHRVKGDHGGQAPRFRHPDRDSAVTEATRLLAVHPDSTFLILQEVGRVKLKGTNNPSVAKCRRAGCRSLTTPPSGMCDEHQPGFAQAAPPVAA